MSTEPRVVSKTTCRACGQGTTGDLVVLGDFYMSQFPEKGQPPIGPRIPLRLMRCHSCGLAQLTHTTPREWLYKQYWYRSGINESMVAALRDVVESARDMVPVDKSDAVLDIGANDGTLLAQYDPAIPEFCPFRVAYEPSDLAEVCQKHADVTCHRFFPDPETARLAFPWASSAGLILYKHIHSIAMFYDLDDPGEFVNAVAKILHPEGIWVVQFGDLLSMLLTTGFDTICHEHLEYWSLTTFMNLVGRYGLKVLDCQPNTVNGGSLRIFVAHKNARVAVAPDAFDRVRTQVLVEEGLSNSNGAYLDFFTKVKDTRKALLKDVILANLIAGKPVDLLAASTKANTLLQYCELGHNAIRRAIERSPEKYGRTTVTGIPIVSEEEGHRNAAEVLLVGAWQFREAFVQRERGRWAPGTKLVFPLPQLEVVTL